MNCTKRIGFFITTLCVASYASSAGTFAQSVPPPQQQVVEASVENKTANKNEDNAQDPQTAGTAVSKTGDDESADAKDVDKTKKDTIDLSSMETYDGFVAFHWDSTEGKLWLELPTEPTSFLYVTSLSTGLGSNPVGLDRGQLGETRVVHFRTVGKHAFLVQENWKYRASTDNAAERQAIKDSFAESILWSTETKTASNGSTVIDASTLLLRDAHDVIGTLDSSGQGQYSLDTGRSHIYLPRCKAFPKNTELESTLTFAGKKAGRLAQRVAADGNSITLRQHHSFVQLPEPGYQPRRFDPRSGCFSIDYADYGVPIEESIEKRLITRHRLEKTDPTAALSPAKEPIVYYVDPGAPEPIRTALIEGASWWNEAFETAGFEDAFQVRVLPEDADPMDVRYNVIQWVHRATRGWSYGQSVADPRTGEIIKGHVLLGSLRVRQDHLLFEGLTDASTPANASICGLGSAAPDFAIAQVAGAVVQADSLELALSRIRQLSAHEVGHTLGFAHNFAASTYADRASVMDYPAPRATVVDGKIDLSDAYGVGIGEWDKFSVQYAYSQFNAADEQAELNKLVADSLARKMLYITDADARPAGAAHPLANLWDNGTEPVSALISNMQVRRIAIDAFDARALAEGQPLSELEKVFVPVYLHHRYQVEAAAKMLGGYYYTYALRGDGQTPIQAVPGDEQRRSLKVLLDTIEPSELLIPQRVLDLIPPQVGSSPSDRERFEGRTSPIFDPANAIAVAADLTISNMLQPTRASRMTEYSPLPLSEVIEQLITQRFLNSPKQDDARTLEAVEIIQNTVVSRLIKLAASDSASHSAKTAALAGLRSILISFNQATETPHKSLIKSEINRFLARPAPTSNPASPLETPPGSPIGG